MRPLAMRLALVCGLTCLSFDCGGKIQSSEPAPRPPHGSCASGAAGAGPNCGVDGTTDCCASALIPGGTFNRMNDARFPATVSSFRMDVFEVTVGRFRAFVEAYPGSRPRPGDGANPHVPDSGWNAAWDTYLPASADALRLELDQCDIIYNPDGTTQTDPACVEYKAWTQTPGGNERLPMRTMTWPVAFAFCAWDGGRLPSDAEWNYASAGGAEQRKFPWGSAPPDTTHAASSYLSPVGSAPAGASRWGVLDLGGSLGEIVADTRAFVPQNNPSFADPPVPCVDCIDRSGDETWRMVRDTAPPPDPSVVVNEDYRLLMPMLLGEIEYFTGIRCVRDP